MFAIEKLITYRHDAANIAQVRFRLKWNNGGFMGVHPDRKNLKHSFSRDVINREHTYTIAFPWLLPFKVYNYYTFKA